SGADGGELSLTGPAFQIGGRSSDTRIKLLDPSFFSQGGFADFELSGFGLSYGAGGFTPGVKISPGTTIRPKVTGWLGLPTGGPDGGLQLARYTRPEGQRPAASLAFNALGAKDPFNSIPIIRGDVVLGANAAIETDAGGEVSFDGNSVTLLGSVTTPGGAISIKGANTFPSATPSLLAPLATVFIGSRAVLDASAEAVIYSDAMGRRTGTIHAGGSVSASGNIIAEKGARIDVSGTTGQLDLSASYAGINSRPEIGTGGLEYQSVRFDTNGGSIAFNGSEMLYTAATLAGRAGGSSAIGGTLSFGSGNFHPGGTAFTSADADLFVTQATSPLAGAASPLGIGLALRRPGGTYLPGGGHLTVASFAGGGFDSLGLDGNVSFSGQVSITMPGRLTVSTSG
ncbi:MAG: hypothetical protein ABL994_22585, partial [Verrucomicrobiales bacterium]